MKVEIDAIGEFPDMKVYFDAFPELSARVLGYIGKQAAMQLYEEHLQGQDIEYHNITRSATGMPRGESGRRSVSYSIGRGLKWVSVSSYPLNLYEKRKKMREGDERRKGILTRKLKSGLSGRLENYIADADKFIVDDWLNEKKKGALKGYQMQ